MKHFNLIIQCILFVLINSISISDVRANHTMDLNSNSQTIIEQDARLYSSTSNDSINTIPRPQNSTLCGVIVLEILVSILVFLKLGSDYLKSNKPYLPNASVSLPF